MRVENTGSNVSQWCEENDEGSTCVDLCAVCASNHSEGSPFIWERHNGDPKGECGHGVDHPPYEEGEYCCEQCGCELTGEDD